MPRQFQFHTTNGVETAEIAVRGRQVLARPMLNFGPGYTAEERRALGLTGLLPPAVNTMSEQLKRVYTQFKARPDNLAKYVYLNSLQDLNEILFYRLVTEHLDEMLPIIYTPTVGEAIQKFSSTFDRARGIYLSIDEPEAITFALESYGSNSGDVDVIVATDSEGILGIGDQGVGGIRISIGKLAVYTTAAGIHPLRGLPIVLDVGTDNLELLNDPNYLGVRKARVRGKQYDEFIDTFVKAVHQTFPNALLHFEDFGANNAHRVLETYRDDYCTFNDDIQGTAAVVVAAALSAVKAKGERLSDQRIVVHGAGTAGIGITDLLCDIMVREGTDPEEASKKFWGLGSRGLLRTGTKMRPFQERYARDSSELKDWDLKVPDRYDLVDVVKNVNPTILIGTSAQPAAFTEEIVTHMAATCERPIIMPLSNPTSKSEAIASDVIKWTQGRALMATGSPFDPVHYAGIDYHIAQANNALVFPGIGLGTVAIRASKVTDNMIAAAAIAVAEMSNATRRGSAVLPGLQQLRAVSAAVALKVAEAAEEDGVARATLENPIQDIHELMWQPRYPKVRAVLEVAQRSARPTDGRVYEPNGDPITDHFANAGPDEIAAQA
ncbi:MAG TPA: NAD-dependent malic enzyme [Propionibacterium sp.]|jgi:malate dehydrogenase (oxaloacetate-decarboxylating)|nr:NAD-dependent malic enzyme [Propionibacterium sp.]